MVDYCADDISSQEAKILIEYIQEKLGSEIFHFYPGVSYRHCLVWKNGRPNPGTLTPPHDITGRKITQYIPNGPYVSELYKLMVQSYNLLKSHPVNLDRIKRGNARLILSGFGAKASVPVSTALNQNSIKRAPLFPL